MTDTENEKMLDAMLPVLGITLPPASNLNSARSQVLLHIGIAREHAARLFSSPISDHLEPAPVFTPSEPPHE